MQQSLGQQTRKRPRYANLVPLRLNISIVDERFLEFGAKQFGISKSEFLRRVLSNAIASWVRQGLYDPEQEPGSR